MGDATRLAYLLAILSSLLLKEDPGQTPELQSRDLVDPFASREEEQPWRDSDGDAEASVPWGFLNIFLPAFYYLLGSLVSYLCEIMWGRLGNWLTSWTGTVQRRRVEVDSNPEPEQHGEGALPSSSRYAPTVPGASGSQERRCQCMVQEENRVMDLETLGAVCLKEDLGFGCMGPTLSAVRDCTLSLNTGAAAAEAEGENVLPASPSSEKPPELPPPPEEPVEAPELPLESPGKEEAAEEGPPDEERGREEAGGLQLELAGTPRCMPPPPSEEREDMEALEPPLEPPRRGEAEETQPQRDSSSSGVPSRSLHTLGGGAAAAGGAEEETGGASTNGGAAPGAKEDRSPEARFRRPEIEGQLRCALLPASPEEGREALADGPPDQERGREEVQPISLRLHLKVMVGGWSKTQRQRASSLQQSPPAVR